MFRAASSSGTSSKLDRRQHALISAGVQSRSGGKGSEASSPKRSTYIRQIARRSSSPGRSRKNVASKRSDRANSGGSRDTSFAVQTTNESPSRSLSHESRLPNNRADTPESPDGPVEPARAFSTSSTITTQGDIASTCLRACRRFASDWPTSEPSNEPTSRIKVGRPVSTPSALAKALFPDPGGPSKSTPFARTPAFRPGRRAREQNALSAPSPPRSANVSPPRWRVSSPDFLSAPALISHNTSGTSRL